VRQGGQSEVREWKVYGFSLEILIFDDLTYDFSWEVMKSTISTFHFMVCFEHFTKKVSILWCVLKATVANYCKIHRWFSEISYSMVQKHMFWASPRRGTDARTDAGIISFELSPLKRCMRINSNKGCPRVTESDWEWSQSQEKRGEREMWDREDRVRWESEKCMVLVERYWYLTILHMILAGRYWNSRFQPIILCCLLRLWRKKYQLYAVFWGRRQLSTVKYISDFLTSPSNTAYNWYFFRQSLKRQHKMIGWNREFQYLPAKIIGKIVKYQDLSAKTIHFSLSHLTLSSLSHIPLSPLSSWLWLHSQSLSVALGHPLFEFILMHLARGLSSKLIIPPCVRASVRPPPRGSSKHMLLHHTVWNFIKYPMYFTVLSYGRPQNTS
jgi:hypothetical protein